MRSNGVGNLLHGVQKAPDLAIVLRSLGSEPVNQLPEALVLIFPLLHGLVSVPVGVRHWHGLDGRLAAAGLRGIGLALPALGRLGRMHSGGPGRGSSSGGRGHRGHGLGRDSIVVVDASHVVLQVPLTGESVARQGAVATIVGAEEGLVTMAMHRVGFPLVAEKAGGGRETGIQARVNLAAVGLQMRVDKLAGGGKSIALEGRTESERGKARAGNVSYS